MTSPDTPMEDTETVQESWNMEKFILEYNRVADEYFGWHYEENSRTVSLETDYENRPASYPTIADFAKVVFDSEQRQ